MKSMMMRLLSVAPTCFFALGCVVSTYGGPGTAPDVPLAPSAAPPPSETPKGPSSIGARHILISFKGASSASPFIDRNKDEARQFAMELRNRVLRGEDMGPLAEEFSDDKGSGQEGGSLGRFKRSDMVKPFADAAFALEVGQVSDVVESPFGFHVIERTE